MMNMVSGIVWYVKTFERGFRFIREVQVLMDLGHEECVHFRAYGCGVYALEDACFVALGWMK